MICSPDFAGFSDFLAGLATTCHHNCSRKSCHLRHPIPLLMNGSQPKHPCRASKSNVRLLIGLRVEASERACIAGEAYYYVLVSDCSLRVARKASPTSLKVKRQRQ